MAISVGKLVEEYLRNNDYDGLCNDECGCVVDDLFPCSGDGLIYDCKPGHRVEGEDGQEIIVEDREAYLEALNQEKSGEK